MTATNPEAAGKNAGDSSDETANRIWEQSARRLRAELADATWHTWFQGVKAVRFENGTLVLSTPNSISADRIRSNYRPMLIDAVATAAGEQVEVELITELNPEPDFFDPKPSAPEASSTASAASARGPE